MPMRQHSRTRLNRIFAQVRLDLQASPVAVDTAQRRAGMTRSELIDVVRNGDAVVLPYTDQLHTYHLFYRAARERFYVAEVTTHPAVFSDGTPFIADIYSIADFEINGGEVSTRFLRVAAGRALDKVSFRAWEARTFGNEPPTRSVRVITYVRNVRDEKDSFLFLNAPVCQPYIDTWGLENAFGHPGFAEWYKRRAERAGFDIERVVALRIADTDKVRLRLDAPVRDCPDCKKARSSLTNELAAPESDDPGGKEHRASGSLFRRLMARFVGPAKEDAS